MSTYGIVDDDTESPAKYLTAVITAQPANQAGVLGGQAVFSFTFSAPITALFTFQWQIQIDGGSWNDLVASAYYVSVTSQSLKVKLLDNFLATRSSVAFRCRLLFAGTVPTFTDSALLTIPLHTNWTAKPIGVGQANFTTLATIALDAALLPTAVGFAGPYTYLWTRTGGAAFACSNVAIQNPTFSYTGTSGVEKSIWTCTISNGGGDTATTDPLYLFAFFSFVGTTALASIQTTPYQVGRLEFMAGANFQAPWTVFQTAPIRNAGGGVQAGNVNLSPVLWFSTVFLNPGEYVDAFVGFTYTIAATSGFCIGVVLLPPDPPI